MEDFVVNGGIRVPIGYRFLPTDEELVDYYLKRKVFARPLPASVIPEQPDVFNSDPWSLPGNLEEKRYFFGKRKGDIIESGNKIGAGSGYWRLCNGKTKLILVDSGASKEAVGMRTTLVFLQGKRARTGWVMREYRLVLGSTAATAHLISTGQVVSEIGYGDWVVYCIFQRKKKTKEHGSSPAASHHDLSNSNSKDLVASSIAQPSVSACLSEVTVEKSSNGFDEEGSCSAHDISSPVSI